ncbi:hypothetical protein MKW92_050371 [Papaver armeniacum]|nr:hypothetical protein MKW92_050371 [Papaver armeniacum]
MKREGRQQHGYVRNYLILPNNSSSTRGVLNSSSSPPLGGGLMMNKISSTSPTTAGAKPWKCAGKYKTRVPKNIKGTQKLKSLDVAMNHKLISWRVVDKGCDLNYRGISATDMLVQLNNRDRDCWDDDDEQDQDLNHNHDYYDDDDVYNTTTVYDVKNNEDLGTELTKLGPVRLVMEQEEEEGESSTSGTTESDADEEEEDDDHMSFCDVGFVVDQLDEEDWCLVEEM